MTGGQGCPDNVTGHRCPGQSDQDYRTELSMWSIVGSPLIFATDPRNMSALQAQVWFNSELVAVNQDPAAGPGATRIATATCSGSASLPLPCETWHRTVSWGDHIVALLNPNDDVAPPGSAAANLTLAFSQLGLPPGTTATVRDLWAHVDLANATDTFVAVNVQPHEARMLSLRVLAGAAAVAAVV